MFQLMERKRGLTQPYPQADIHEPMFRFSEMTRLIYKTTPPPGSTHNLCDLVEMCLNSKPANRPLVKSLQKMVEDTLWHGSRDREREDGYMDPKGDTLLLPDAVVNLKWASRIVNGLEHINDTRVLRNAPKAQQVPGAQNGDIEMKDG